MKKNIFILIASLIVIGCGGGGSDSTVDNIKTGTFIDAQVEGLHYKTETQDGFTDKNGHFKYKEGEHITFNIGNFEFGGKFLAKKVMTPYDIAKKGDTKGPAFFASVIQSLDETPNDSSHIKLSKKLVNFKIDFDKYQDITAADIVNEAGLFMGKDYDFIDLTTAKNNMDKAIEEFKNRNSDNTSNKIPNFTGYDTIRILNNVNSNNKGIKSEIEMYNGLLIGNATGKASVTSIRVYCTDYGYNSNNLIMRYIINGIEHKTYISSYGFKSCSEENYLDSASSNIRGNDTVVMGTINN